MKIKYLVIPILFFSALSVCSQANEVQKQSSYITLNFISPFVGISPRWKAGIYTPIAKNVYFGTEFGYGSEWASPEAKIKLGRRYKTQRDYKSFEIAPELIVMIHPKHFVSAKYYHLSHSSSIKNGTILSQPDELYYDFTSLDYHRTVSGFHVFYGYMDKISQKVGFMLKIGYGGRNKTVNLSNIEGRKLSSSPNANGFATTRDGSEESLPFAFDLKIYYTLN
ncbi:MAG: hypothetical protein ABJG78_02815 [Cyclobacteriaceae bacterium]